MKINNIINDFFHKTFGNTLKLFAIIKDSIFYFFLKIKELKKWTKANQHLKMIKKIEIIVEILSKSFLKTHQIIHKPLITQ
ncbi:hypothetical protein [Chryseobacterium sp. 3008163]|uniref:hypothetical protein n=1 Tax=Chryseobacterium sp. 3008163 TaxID=2478663 RepID=UPI000F0C9707|nr:hypothetical protein [Chryseobacterium sp. 3008163]AYM99513.1 hypothetical protein EAG08_03410 [Chryseobacterium sp. 3008163]